jgi:UDP-GlcNAc:undecaprenyl-phosphate GlcNAc-1-phosphate transferase
LLDDLIHLQPLAKLIAQCITASLVFFLLDIRLTSFYGLFSDQPFPLLLSYIVTLCTVILITNSMNLIDGIDGLAAAFSFIACAIFGTWFTLTGQYTHAIVCLTLCGAILAFLFQNWEPSKIFMGDTGSLVIGTILSIITIQFINRNYGLPVDHPLRFNSSIGTAISVMIIPLADTCRIIIIRLYKRISPFAPDKRHIHHALVRLNLSHRQAVYTLTLVHITMVAIAIACRNAHEWILLAILLSVTILLCLILDHLLRRAVQKETSVKEEQFHR